MRATTRLRQRVSWWQRLFPSLGAAAGLLTAGLASDASPVAAQDRNYRSAREVPASWQDFAKQLQARFEQRLAADDDRTRHVQDLVARRGESANGTPQAFRLRTWILASGRVERVEFEGLSSDVATALRSLLINSDVGAPPPDMLQPVHLRFSLRPNAEQRQKQ